MKRRQIRLSVATKFKSNSTPVDLTRYVSKLVIIIIVIIINN